MINLVYIYLEIKSGSSHRRCKHTIKYSLLHPLPTLPLTRADHIWCIVTILRDCSQHKSSIMFHYITLHLPETLSSGAQQPAGSVHTCQHITVTFLFSTTALISIYCQTNTGGKVRVPASKLRVMAGIKCSCPSPR